VTSGSAPKMQVDLDCDFLIEANQWDNLSDLEDIIHRAIKVALDHVQKQEGIHFLPQCELSLVFLDDAAMRLLNRDHRGKDKATNVLSFPIDEDADPFGPMLGDIVFAFETIDKEASGLGVAFAAHLSHLCIHGFLHLLGYDHIEADEAEAMERVEIAILARLDIDNPYAGSDPLTMPD
jgi:probable rRNA maturation factor